MKPLRATAVVLALASCRSVETVRGDGFVLQSPFGREATAAWKTRVERELSATAAFLDAPIPDPPLDVRFEPVEVGPEIGASAHLAPDVDGAKGWTIDGHEVHVIVDAEDDGLFSMSADGTLRHEFVHALLHHAGIPAPAWLDEGLAHEVEGAVTTADGLRLHPAPLHLLAARAYARTFDASRVWSWDGSRETTRDDQSALRTLSRSFVRFLIERDGDAWTRDLRAWASLRPADDPSLVNAWRTWLDELDIVGRVERGTGDRDADVRAAAASALASLAEFAQTAAARDLGIDRAVDARTDQAALALAAGADPVCAESGGAYLVYYRFDAVTDDAVRGLVADDARPWTRLIGLAVQARRGRRIESREAQPSWDAMSPAARARFSWAPLVLPITR
jgi:hypothetical protein